MYASLHAQNDILHITYAEKTDDQGSRLSVQLSVSDDGMD